MPSLGAEYRALQTHPGSGRSWGWGHVYGDGVRGLALQLISILSISRTVLLWFGPQDTMRTVPQPCKVWGRPRWDEPFGAGPGQERVETGGRTGGGAGRMGCQDFPFLLPGASASSTPWPSPAGSCSNRARPAGSSLWTGYVLVPSPFRPRALWKEL